MLQVNIIKEEKKNACPRKGLAKRNFPHAETSIQEILPAETKIAERHSSRWIQLLAESSALAKRNWIAIDEVWSKRSR